MYTLQTITVSKPLLISYVAEKTGSTYKKVQSFLLKDTAFKESFEYLLKEKTASIQDLIELSEIYTIFSSDPFYK